MIERPKKIRLESYIGINLRLLRKRLHYSLDDIAYASGCSKAYLSQLENQQTANRTSVEIAYNLYKALKDEINISFEDFCMTKVSSVRFKKKHQEVGE